MTFVESGWGCKEVSLRLRRETIEKAKKSLYARTKKKPIIDSVLRGTSLHLDGSFTIEAAILIPLFVMISVGVFLFSRIMILEWGISCSLDKSVRVLAMSADIVDSVSEKLLEDEEKGDNLELAAVILYAKEQMIENEVSFGYIELGEMGIDYTDSEVTSQEINIVVHYRVKMPFPAFTFGGWEITQSARAHRWVGYDPTEDENGIRYVYVTEYGEAYHLDRNCAYLNPSIRTISRGELSTERSSDGGKYNKCPICGDHDETTLYVTDWGGCYHSRLSCSGLKRSVKIIPYDEAVESYHECSKCGGE